MSRADTPADLPAQVPLHRIVYTSRARQVFGACEVDALQRQAAADNARDGVTGLLLYDGTRFMQALEGAPGPVRALMARIAADPRHVSISYLADEPIAAREFGGWALALRWDSDAQNGRTFVAQVKADVAALGDVRLRAAFIGFAVLGAR